MTNPNEPTLTCSEVVERLPMSAKEFGESMNQFDPLHLWLNSPFVNQHFAIEFAEAYAKKVLHEWREQIRKGAK